MATDYISRDYAVENMENFPWDTEHDKNAAIHLVRELVPPTDVVEVVRCKECLHRCRNETCEIAPAPAFAYVSDMDFCSRGKRRTDNGK